MWGSHETLVGKTTDVVLQSMNLTELSFLAKTYWAHLFTESTTKPSNKIKSGQHNQDENNTPRDHKRCKNITLKCHVFSFFWIEISGNHNCLSEDYHENNISDLRIAGCMDQLLYNFSRRQIAFEAHCSSSAESAAHLAPNLFSIVEAKSPNNNKATSLPRIITHWWELSY